MYLLMAPEEDWSGSRPLTPASRRHLPDYGTVRTSTALTSPPRAHPGALAGAIRDNTGQGCQGELPPPGIIALPAETFKALFFC